MQRCGQGKSYVDLNYNGRMQNKYRSANIYLQLQTLMVLGTSPRTVQAKIRVIQVCAYFPLKLCPKETVILMWLQA